MINGNEHTSSGFDQLLSLAMLERNDLFNQANNETMAQQVFTSAEFSAIENKNVLEKLNAEFGRNGSKKWWLNILIIAAITGTAITAVVMNSGSPVATVTPTTNGTQPSTPENNIIVTAADIEEEKTAKLNQEMVMPVVDDSIVELVEEPGEIKTPGFYNYGNTYFHIPEPYPIDDAQIPVLTESQKKQNEKLKLQMLRDVFKKKSYAFTEIPAGPAWRNGERFEVATFMLQCAEVSNWQYNVFLNDLLMQGREDDYIAARPVDANWKTVGIPEFENNYARGEGYSKFPALNIPREGAELYCSWLTNEMAKAIDNKDVKYSKAVRPEFRLPSDIEWLRAARGNHDSTMQFPWGYRVNALQNAKGCYLCNFNYGISKDVLSPIESDGKNCISDKKTTRSVVTTAGRSIDTLVLGPEYCYNPTDFGTYCMMGNAAEMVWTYDKTQPGMKGGARAMGGSWYSHADNVRIESKEQFVGVTEGNVEIGFRVVMIYSIK